MELTEVTKFRRAVLTGLARFTWQGTLPEHIYDILYSVVTEDSPRVRCCVHKERAVLKNRINMALGLTVGLNIVEASKIALIKRCLLLMSCRKLVTNVQLINFWSLTLAGTV